MKERKPDIKYSDPVKEILGNPPAKILRWGTAVMFSVFVLLIILSWLIKYPDAIPSPVTITTFNPPVTLVSKITGNIKHLYPGEKERVAAGQLIAVMETTANIKEIEQLKSSIDTIMLPSLIDPRILPDLSELGELQVYYASFLRNLSNLDNYNKNDLYGGKIASLKVEISRIQEYISRLIVKEKLVSENQKIEAGKFHRDSLLLISRSIADADLEKAHQALLRTSIELEQVRLDHSEKSIELAEIQQILQDYIISRVEEKDKLVSILTESFMNLKAQIGIWENTYLLKSPIDGTVAFTKFWNINQSVVKDEAVVNIIPFEPGDFIGRISLKMQRSGKVKPGQTVNIKLSGFPYLEYGMVRGTVKSKSLVPSGDSYIIEISLPDGLTTMYGIKLDFTQNMQGTAEVMTDNLRLIQKIVNPFRYLISKNRIRGVD
jgi:multidrug efflux pump subunit AcrA (membrane-fusion protein)